MGEQNSITLDRAEVEYLADTVDHDIDSDDGSMPADDRRFLVNLLGKLSRLSG
jgi:hypothetical protein